MRYTRCWNGPRCTCAGALRKSSRFTLARTGTTPAPVLPRYVVALTSAAAAGLALIAATTCAAVLVSAPVSLVARLTTMSLPVTATLSGALATPGFLNSAVTSSPPVWPHSNAVSTTAEAAEAAALPEVGWTMNVKSPRSPWKPNISKV